MTDMIEPMDAYEIMKNDTSCQIIDVREPAEFRSCHIIGARNIPLSKLESGDEVLAGEGKLLICCQRGMRAERACQIVRGTAAETEMSVIRGGLNEWKQNGLPVEEDSSAPIAMERQVQIVAGSLVVLGILLGVFVNQWFLALSAFVGCGLVFAGATNTCGMAMLLRRLPYNH